MGFTGRAIGIFIIIAMVAIGLYYLNDIQTQNTLPSPTPSDSLLPSSTPTSSNLPSPSTTPISSSTPSPSIFPSPSTAPSPTPSLGPTPVPPTQTTDLNWGGYTSSTDLINPQPLITSVSGSWMVPKMGPSSIDTYSAIWVGIGGTFDNSLIQAGTEQDFVNGSFQYSAWYETLPLVARNITTIEVSPGDRITTSINLKNSRLSEWTISMVDETNGQSFTIQVIYDARKLSAEWVVERPDVGNTLSDLSNFGNVELINCSMIVNGENSSINDYPSIRINMTDSQGNPMVDVSDLSATGNSFIVKFLKSR